MYSADPEQARKRKQKWAAEHEMPSPEFERQPEADRSDVTALTQEHLDHLMLFREEGLDTLLQQVETAASERRCDRNAAAPAERAQRERHDYILGLGKDALEYGRDKPRDGPKWMAVASRLLAEDLHDIRRKFDQLMQSGGTDCKAISRIIQRLKDLKATSVKLQALNDRLEEAWEGLLP